MAPTRALAGASCSCRPRSRCWSASASFAVGAWRMTARQRRARARAILEAPAALHGHASRAAFEAGSPAALAGYELPMGLLGFPGMGWLFAGFPFTASILLLAGPALRVGRDPARLLALRAGPASHVGWKVELVWLPASSARVGAPALPGATRRRRTLEGARRPRSPPPRARSYRTSVGVAAGAIVLLLVSLPFVPAVAGCGRRARPLRVPDAASHPRSRASSSARPGPGQALRVAGARRRTYPADALRVHAATCGRSLVRAAAVDDPPHTGSSTSTEPPVPLRGVPRRRGSSSSRHDTACARAVTCSSPPTRGCSAAATSRT